MNIIGKKVTLRAIEENDLPKLHKWANAPELQDAMGSIHFPSSFNFHQRWFEKLQTDQLNQRFAIEVPDLGLIGISSIINIDWRNNHAWHGVMIGDEDIRGKGYGIDAIMATMRYAFDELHLKRLDGSMIEYNTVSINSYCGKKLGWSVEGRKKDFFFRKGRYWDQVIVGITESDYRTLTEEQDYWGSL